jgi:hypothetical protein
MSEALEQLRAAYVDPANVATTTAVERLCPICTLGTDAPREYLVAASFRPLRLTPGGLRLTPRADAAMGTKGLGTRGRLLLDRILGSEIPLLITAADAEQAQLFAVLRELARLGAPDVPPIHLIDLVHIDRPAALTYNRARLEQLGAWLVTLGGLMPNEAALTAAIGQSNTRGAALAQLPALRREARLSGSDALTLIATADLAPAAAQSALLDAASTPPLPGHRLFVTGSAQEDGALYALIEQLDGVIVGEDHGWGMDYRQPVPVTDDPLTALAAPALRATPGATSAEQRAKALAIAVKTARPSHVLHVTIDGDEAAPWDVAAMRRHLPADLPFLALSTPAGGDEKTRVALEHFLAGTAPPQAPAKSRPSVTATAPRPARSRKSLASVGDFGVYQRDWFAGVRDRVSAGEPFAVVNANSPQEIFRALDIPFVVNQWWASIVAAKQQSRRYIGLLRERHFPTAVEPYSAQGLAASFDDDAELAPWGGLPRPHFVQALTSSDPTIKIFSEWARASGADPYLYARTNDPRIAIPLDWWKTMPDAWDTVLEPERLDLMTAELREVIARLETATGRTFDHDRFVEIMDLVNEQEDYYRRTRDLIACSYPAPIGIVDSMPATMVPQWHRGTVWARDAARAFYEEVLARVEAGAAATPNERVRLMWVGRGLWSDMAFYQKWEESHGAVFVWSMYLALAADGYIRRFDRDRDPLRALAARFLTMGDELRMPSWAAPWHVHEAETHGVDGAVALADADPFVLRALERAGIPVLDLGIDNFNREGNDDATTEASITAFIEGPVGARAAARRQAS